MSREERIGGQRKVRKIHIHFLSSSKEGLMLEESASKFFSGQFHIINTVDNI